MNEEPIIRLNDGVVTMPIDTLHLVLDEWFHTYAIPLPRRPSPADIRHYTTELTNTVTDAPYLFNSNQSRYLYESVSTASCSTTRGGNLSLFLNRHALLFTYQNAHFLQEM
jgi:hypothetical protein